MYKINRWGAAFLLLAGMACWVCSPLGARAPEKMRANSGQIGQFSREGEYVKDYFVIKKGRTFHLFYNVGVANDTQDWQEPDSEKAFGHATSTDLVHWEHAPARHPGRSRYVGGAGRIRSVHREAQGNVLHGLYRVRRPLAGQANRRSGYQQGSVRLGTLSGKSGLYGAGVGDAQSDRLGGLPGFAHPAIWAGSS